jgi:2-polyprenyl-3-methyl-5-hydroxy-6-metoxy-1,4-benzoquinol methylase
MPPSAAVFDCLLPLMQAKAVTLAPEEFHQLVNLTYHRFEAGIYDEDHREMWESLPIQFDLLTRDVLAHGKGPGENLRVLDVGCGTGMGSAQILQTVLGKHIAHIDLLDTSPEMLARCATRAATWGITYQTILGSLQAAPAAPYDLIIASSVLHHIPDLTTFLDGIRARQKEGGYFLHIQDPNADQLRDAGLLRRMQELRDATQKKPQPAFRQLLAPARLARRAWRTLFSPAKPPSQNYLELLNDELLKAGVIKEPMSDEEIWSVTDIHVDNLPFSTRQGISLRAFRAQLPEYELISSHSYAFFGRLWSTLPPRFQEKEMQFVRQGAPNGYKIAAAWKRTK